MSTSTKTSGQPHANAGLVRSLGYRDLIAYGLAYIAPIAPLSTLGFVWDAAGGLIALAYLLGALCMYFTAKSYAVMTAEVPSAGSVYGIARYSLGAFPGFMAGWLILLDYLLIPALVFLLMSVAMGTLIPQIDRSAWLLILVAASTAINWRGVEFTSRVNMLSVLAQFAIVIAVLACGTYALYHGAAPGLSAHPFYDARTFSSEKIFTATSICVLSFLGFDAISTLAEEVKGGDRTLVGRAIIHVLLISGAVFVLTAWVLGSLMPGAQIKDPASAIYELTGQRIGPWFAVALAWLMALIVGFTNAIPMQMGVARVLFAMGRDRQLPAVFARLHNRSGTPHFAMLFATALCLAIAVVMRNRIDQLATFVNFGALSAFLLLHVSVLVKMAWRGRSKQYFTHWCVPLLGIAVVLLVFSGMDRGALQVGSAWLLVGLVYGLFLRSRQRTELAV